MVENVSDENISINEDRILYSENDIEYLKQRWFSINPNLLEVNEKYWNLFDRLYREPQRHYHNFFHLKKLYEFYDFHAVSLLNSLPSSANTTF